MQQQLISLPNAPFDQPPEPPLPLGHRLLLASWPLLFYAAILTQLLSLPLAVPAYGPTLFTFFWLVSLVLLVGVGVKRSAISDVICLRVDRKRQQLIDIDPWKHARQSWIEADPMVRVETRNLAHEGVVIALADPWRILESRAFHGDKTTTVIEAREYQFELETKATQIESEAWQSWSRFYNQQQQQQLANKNLYALLEDSPPALLR